jgi:uncharacterized membrane protein YesL
VADLRRMLLLILLAIWLMLAGLVVLGLCRAAGAMPELEQGD